MENDRSYKKFQGMIILVGKKIIDIESKTKTSMPLEEIQPDIHSRIYFKRHRTAVLESIKRTDEFIELLDAFLKSPDISGDGPYLEEILNEFVFEVINEVCYGLKWNEKWVDQELSFMTEAVLHGLLKQKSNIGIIIPLHNISMNEFQINLGEFGILRRANLTEKVRFAVRYLKENQDTRGSGFKYVLDVGQVDSQSLFPVPNKYLKILERTIFALRLHYGGGVGVDYIHFWSYSPKPQDETVTITIPISSYLKHRGDETRIISRGYGKTIKTEDMKQTIRNIHTLGEDSFYLRAFRRHGSANYTLDFGFGDAIVDCIIALECLFGNKPQAIPRILELTREKQQDIFWQFETGRYGKVQGIDYKILLKKCWTARHKIAHGESSASAEKEAGMKLFYLSEIARLFLRYSLLSVSELGFPERENLHDMLDKKEE